MWEVLEDVIADGIAESLPHRFFVVSTGERYEIPATDMVFHFSKERGEMIAAVNAAKGKEQASANTESMI